MRNAKNSHKYEIIPRNATDSTQEQNIFYFHESLAILGPPFLPFDEAVASRAVSVIVSESAGRTEKLLESAK